MVALSDGASPTVGVLALQGAYRAHRLILERLGATVREVKRPEALEQVDALVMPGGESTTMSMLLDRSDLREPLAHRLAGDIDYILKVRVKNARAYDTFYQALISEVRIYNVTALLSMEEIKSTTVLPL